MGRGNALSPLIGRREDLFYARYRDDFIIFTQTQWHLRKAIKRLHEFFDLGGLRHIRIKPSLVGLSGVLTGWGCGMPPKGPG